ncbi:MAG: SRPBCC domain-containing protein [Nitrospinota bacterium]
MAQEKTASENAVFIQRTFKLPRERVFRAWTDAEEMKKWFAPSDDFTIPAAEVDLRVGGKYRIAMKSPDGNMNVAVGTYKEVRPPEKLAFTWTWAEGGMDVGESLVTVEFRERGGETEVSLTHELLPTDEARQAHSEGWNGCLGRLETSL